MKKPVLPKRFHAFTLTQSLGAFNDHVFKMLLQLYVLQVIISAHAEVILSQATFVFTVPFVLFGPWAGYLSDKYAKSRLIRIIKSTEIVIMTLGVAAFWTGNIAFMLAVLFLMAAQSTFFSPCKLGLIPEVCQPEAITHANSWIEMTTFISIIAGTALTGFLLTAYSNNGVYVAIYCVVFAVMGAMASMFIPNSEICGTEERFPWNPLTGIWRDLAFLNRQPSLWLASLANSYFWLVGLVFTTNILVYGRDLLGISEQDNALMSSLPAYMGVGIAAGSMLAGRWSGRKVELGLVPLGGVGMGICGLLLFLSHSNYVFTALVLFVAGVSGGLYVVPLYAFLQFVAKPHEKGRVMATFGVLSGLFLVVGSILYTVLAVMFELGPHTIYLIMGVLTLFVVLYICTIIPEYFIRFFFWLLTHTFYDIRIEGEENMPLHGGALIASNHVSFIDAFLIGSTMQRLIRFIMLKEFYHITLARWLFDLMKAIPIAPEEGRESVTQTMMRARQDVQNGHVVCIFPEGGLTRDGSMGSFKDGFESIMHGLSQPVIPVYMSNVWGSIFSHYGKKVFWKWPRRIPYRVVIKFGKPLPASVKADQLEAAVRLLSGSGSERPA